MKLINPEVRIETTNRCNANCVMCARDKMTRPKGTMTTRTFNKLAIQARDLGANLVSLFGFGEPLLDKELKFRIRLCKTFGMDTFITTNGSLCTWEKMFELFSAGLTHIRFSVHGKNGEYERIQHGLKYDTAMTNIFSALHLRDKLFPDRKISVTVTPMNGDSIEQLREWELIGVDWLEIWRAHNWGTVKRYRPKTEKQRRCFRPLVGPLQIQWDGNIIPCCFLTNAEIVLGNAHKQTLEEILKGKPYEEFRQRHEEGNLEGLPCYDCDQRNIEHENPLLYSNRDKERKINTTSSMKFELGG